MNCSVPVAADALFAPHFHKASGIVVAVSGGPDSMALLHLLSDWKNRPRLCVATVDHDLRADSAAEAGMVAKFAHGLGIEHTTLLWRGAKPDAGIQQAAREARYRLLASHAMDMDCSHIVTGHHADDQAETVLLRLLAGSGIAGLAAMESEISRDLALLVRPLLGVPKAELIAYCEQNGVPFVSDPGNLDIRYGRTRMRQLMSDLADDGLTRQRLCKLAERASRANAALEDIADLALKSAFVQTVPGLVSINWNTVSHQPAEIRLRVMIAALERARASADPMRLERLETLETQITHAQQKNQSMRRTIADRIVTLDREGLLSITPAPPRKRGMLKA